MKMQIIPGTRNAFLGQLSYLMIQDNSGGPTFLTESIKAHIFFEEPGILFTRQFADLILSHLRISSRGQQALLKPQTTGRSLLRGSEMPGFLALSTRYGVLAVCVLMAGARENRVETVVL